MPPKPAPTKLATALFGATQHRKAREPSMGNTNSGRNCQRMTASSTRKKTFDCLRDSAVGFSRCCFCVSKRAVWQSLRIIVSSIREDARTTQRQNSRCEPWELRVVDKKLPSNSRKGVAGPHDTPHEEDGHGGVDLRVEVQLGHGDGGVAEVVRRA